jgi:copper chaperone CopZ
MLNVLSRSIASAALLLLVVTATNPVEAADTTTATVITVGEMCGGCVKKINAKFENVNGIGSVSCDIPTKTVTLTPASGYRLKPRVLWEMMDEIGKTPTKLVGPNGTFTEKPAE